jgi:anaerobic selenocysteine-containing dehydrogenase
LGISEGDLCEISSPRGTIQAPARVSGIREGVAFVPFHYGDWDREPGGARHAANELTITQWDPVSKQPIFKTGKVRVRKLAEADRQPSSAPAVGASAPVAAA